MKYPSPIHRTTVDSPEAPQATTQKSNQRGGETIRLFSVPWIIALVLAALAFFGDRALDSITTQRQITGIVLLATILEALVLVLLVIWNIREKRKERKEDALRREDESVS